MKRIAAVVLSLSSFAAVAQTGGMPPSQPPAGRPDRFAKPTLERSQAVVTTTDEAVRRPTTKAERRLARKAVRKARVGDKPLN